MSFSGCAEPRGKTDNAHFEITVQRRSGADWPVVVEQSAAWVFLPVRAEGTLRLDPTVLTSQTTRKEYGLVLRRALFRGEVRDAFVQALAKSQDYLRSGMGD